MPLVSALAVLVLAQAPADPSQPRTASAQPEPPAAECPDRSAENDAYAIKVADSPFRRTGVALGMSLAASGCDTGDFCRGRGYWSRLAQQGGMQGQFAVAPGVGPSVSLELGVRPIPYVEVDAFGEFSYYPTRLTLPPFIPEGDPFTMSFGFGVAVLGRPLAFSRFDPYLGLGLGYHEYRSTLDFTEAAGLQLRMGERLQRLLVKLSLGLDIFVARQVALGPRLDYGFFAAGQYCNTLEQVQASGVVMDTGGCNDVSFLLDQTDPEGDAAAGSLPRFWRAGLQLRFYL